MKQDVGKENRNGLLLLAKTKRRSKNHPYALEWEVFCHVCLQESVVNSCDFFQRHCPNCGEGK